MKILLLGDHKDKKEIVNILIRLDYGIYDLSTIPNKFSFDQIDSGYKAWGADDYIKALGHEKAQELFRIHKEVIEYCYACLLLLPATDSDMFLAGLVRGKNKKVFAYNNKPLVIDINHLFLNKILSSPEDVTKTFKRSKEDKLSKFQAGDPKKKKTRKKQKEKSNGVGKHNAKEFFKAYKEAKRTGMKDFKFEGNKIPTDYAKHMVEYLTNKGWI